MQLIIYSVFIGIMSLITFILYGADKRKAKKGEWRIKEKTLLLFSVFGGGIGGFLGMALFRHKTKHWYFVLINTLFAAVYIAIFILLFIHFGF